jgi:hypothetical protein
MAQLSKQLQVRYFPWLLLARRGWDKVAASGDMGFTSIFFCFFPHQKVPKHPDLGVAYWTIPLLGYGSWMELVSVKLFLCPGGWFPRHDQVPARILWVRVWKMANRGKDWIGILGSPWALVPLQ